MTEQDHRDRAAIADVMARYTINGDRGRVEALAALFGAAGTLRFSGTISTGQAAIAARLSGHGIRNPALTLTRHHLTSSMVELAGDVAHGRSYFQVLTDIGLDHHGVYVDVLEKRDGHWWFRDRQVRIDWQSAASLYPAFDVRKNKALFS